MSAYPNRPTYHYADLLIGQYLMLLLRKLWMKIVRKDPFLELFRSSRVQYVGKLGELVSITYVQLRGGPADQLEIAERMLNKGLNRFVLRTIMVLHEKIIVAPIPDGIIPMPPSNNTRVVMYRPDGSYEGEADQEEVFRETAGDHISRKRQRDIHKN